MSSLNFSCRKSSEKQNYFIREGRREGGEGWEGGDGGEEEREERRKG